MSANAFFLLLTACGKGAVGGTFHTCCSTAHPHTRGLILSASDGIWNMLFSTCYHTSRWVRFRFGGRLSLVVAHVRPTHHFALSRLAILTHAVAARLRLSVTTWQHVHRRVLRELDIEFEPTRHWTSDALLDMIDAIDADMHAPW